MRNARRGLAASERKTKQTRVVDGQCAVCSEDAFRAIYVLFNVLLLRAQIRHLA